MKLNTRRIARTSLFLCSLAVSYLVLQRISYPAISILLGCYLFAEFYSSSKERKIKLGRTEESTFRVAELLYEETCILGASTIGALERICRMISSEPKVSGVISEICTRMRLGQQFSEALDYSGAEAHIKRSIFNALGYDGNSAELHPESIKSRLDERDRQRADFYEELGHSTQKYVTLGMVSSTVVPSLALFGLTGYSITGSSPVLPLIFLVLFAGILPMAYRLNNIKMVIIDG